MSSKSDAETSKDGPVHNVDLTLESRIDKAIKELAENRYLDGLRQRDEAYEKLKKQSKEQLVQDKVGQRLYEHRNRWHENVVVRRRIEFRLGSFLNFFIFILALLIYPAISKHELAFNDYFFIIVLVAFVISFWRAFGRYRDESFKISLRDRPSLLIGTLTFTWHLLLIGVYFGVSSLWPSLNTQLSQLFNQLSKPLYANPLIISALLSIPLVIYSYRRYEKSVVASQVLLEQNTEGEYKREAEKIDHDLKGIVEKIGKKLEQDYDLDKQNPWDTKVPKYSSQQPWRKLGERHDVYLETTDFVELKKYIENMDKGNIGIAGVRGYGKTALMRALNDRLDDDASNKYLTVWLSAPTAVVDEKEFLLSVLAKLATRVGAKLTKNKFWPALRPDEALEKEDRSRRQTKWAIVLLVTGLFPIILFVIFRQQFPLELKFAMTSFFLYPVLLFLWRFIRFVGPRRFGLTSKKDRPVVAASADLLEELWYVRTDKLSSNVSLSHFGVSFNGGSGIEKTREPFTLPHLIQMWDDFVKYVTNSDPDGFEKVIVFIDEVDKIKDVDNIGRFMLILKALYNPLNLFFVVSISEDAFARFRKRTSPIGGRDEFDSSFDHTLCIGPIDHCQTRKLLNDRILGYDLPIPVALLIWMLSRGNPRDTIRLARNVLENYQEGDCKWIAWNLCSEQFKETFDDRYQSALKRSQLNFETLSQLSDLDVGLRKHLKQNIVDRIEKIWKTIKVFRQPTSLSEADRDSRKLSSEEVQAELGYALTIYELFCSNRDPDCFRRLMENDDHLRLIGSVQNCLSVRTGRQALDKLNKFRSCAGLKKIDDNMALCHPAAPSPKD